LAVQKRKDNMGHVLPTQEKTGNFKAKQEINHKPMSTTQLTIQPKQHPKITDFIFYYPTGNSIKYRTLLT